ncbi:MAG TPA: glycosyltransferase, partial [Opitutae bacterium]|nr:glycosyltransferase [Opitutae bacterium]
VILTIAGGKQEVLGYWLRNQLDYEPTILCIGAAIAFLTGKQVSIPKWADRIYIGWLLRIITDPKTFLPRYWSARKLRSLLKRWGTQMPQSSQH